AYDPALVLDFGRQVKGCLELEVEGPSGATLDVGFAEQLIDGWFNNSLECQLCARYILREGRQVWRLFSWRSWRYLKLRLRNTGPVRIYRLQAIEERWPAQGDDNFRCEDERLQRIYNLCSRTLDLGCGEIFMDTPWREQGQWLGDAAGVTVEMVLANWPDVSLAGKYLCEAAWNKTEADGGLLLNITSIDPGVGPNRNTIPDYSLWWVRALWIYYLNTGRIEYLDTLFPDVRGVLGAFGRHVNADGLVEDMPGWIFIDWAAVDREGVGAALNGIYALALECGAKIADEIGEADSARDYRGRLARLRDAFARTFWDEARGCFADARRDGYLSRTISEHTNALALWAGLASPEQARCVVKNIFRHPLAGVVEAQPFFTAFVMQALDAVGEFDLAMDILRERWGSRMVDPGYETALEEWSCLGSPRNGQFEGFLRSQSHAWSAAPVYFLIDNLIGLKILKPGGKRIVLEPRMVGADYRVRRPLAGGWLTVECCEGEVRVETPPDVELLKAEGTLAATRV
ncbi:MAG: family 78 glycoside hydrolase catalytic domain, partial [Verrucomicrobiota bacterium JB024]|nr:family 78 glycoside hydrolase catalytic domain [Verrucomicrobiota bacterium JB024]